MPRPPRPPPYEPCFCGSGKRYKFCCRAQERTGPGPIQVAKGVVAYGVELTVVNSHREEKPIARWFLRLARTHALLAQQAGASEYETFQTILMTAAAGEALANRLLEPLEEPTKWEKLERSLKPIQKWERLSEHLKLSPPLAAGAEPLQSLRRVADLRNELMHFKHSRNLNVSESSEMPVDWRGRGRGGFVIPVDKVLAAPLETKQRHTWDEDLHPGRAAGYLQPLLEALRAVLASYPEDEFSIVASLREELAAPL